MGQRENKQLRFLVVLPKTFPQVMDYAFSETVQR